MNKVVISEFDYNVIRLCKQNFEYAQELIYEYVRSYYSLSSLLSHKKIYQYLLNVVYDVFSSKQMYEMLLYKLTEELDKNGLIDYFSLNKIIIKSIVSIPEKTIVDGNTDDIYLIEYRGQLYTSSEYISLKTFQKNYKKEHNLY